MDEDERMRTIVVQSSNNDTEPSHLDIFLRLYWFIGKVDTEQKVIALKKEYKLEDACKYLREQKFLDHFMLIDKSKHNRIVHFQEKISGERLEAEKKLLQSMRLCSVEEFIDTIFVDRELVRNIDKLLELFDKISASRLFCDFPELQSHHHPSIPKAMEGTQTTTHSSIIWFDLTRTKLSGLSCWDSSNTLSC
jgi:hypothetical protein